jgi:hypothetical protein
MTGAAELAALAEIAGLVRDARIAALAAATARCAATEAAIQALSRPAEPAEAAANPVTQALVAQRHAAWAEARRMTLNLELARARAARLEAIGPARLAVGRAEALARLVDGGR